jgi:hypothetical protein
VTVGCVRRVDAGESTRCTARDTGSIVKCIRAIYALLAYRTGEPRRSIRCYCRRRWERVRGTCRRLGDARTTISRSKRGTINLIHTLHSGCCGVHCTPALAATHMLHACTVDLCAFAMRRAPSSQRTHAEEERLMSRQKRFDPQTLCSLIQRSNACAIVFVMMCLLLPPFLSSSSQRHLPRPRPRRRRSNATFVAPIRRAPSLMSSPMHDRSRNRIKVIWSINFRIASIRQRALADVIHCSCTAPGLMTTTCMKKVSVNNGQCTCIAHMQCLYTCAQHACIKTEC